MRELLLLAHPTTAVLGMLCALWFLVEAFNASPNNRGRIRLAGALTGLLMLVTWVLGGYWYVTFYAADKALILGSSWAFAHNIFMETKEHAFFITLILALYLWIISAKENLAANRAARNLGLWVAGLIIVSALFMEGAGSIIAMGVRVGLMHG